MRRTNGLLDGAGGRGALIALMVAITMGAAASPAAAAPLGTSPAIGEQSSRWNLERVCWRTEINIDGICHVQETPVVLTTAWSNHEITCPPEFPDITAYDFAPIGRGWDIRHSGSEPDYAITGVKRHNGEHPQPASISLWLSSLQRRPPTQTVTVGLGCFKPREH